MMVSGGEQEEVYTLLLTDIPVDSLLKASIFTMSYICIVKNFLESESLIPFIVVHNPAIQHLQQYMTH